MSDSEVSDPDLTDQEEAAKDIDQFEARMKKTPKDRRTVGWLKTNLELLNHQWADFCNRHRVLARKRELKENSYFKNDVFGVVQMQYCLTKTVILNLLSPGREQSTIEADQDGESVELETPSFRAPLPKLQLPNFSGNPLEWETFKEMFLALVHNVAKMPPILKLQYLVGALSGEAATKIKNVQISAKNYDGVWQSLIKKYDNKRLLISAHMSNIISCPAASKRSVDELGRIMDVMEESTRGLTNLDCKEEVWNHWVIYHTVHKMDRETRTEWKLSLGDEEDFPKYKTVSTFVEKRIRALASAQSDDQSPKLTPNTGNKPKSGKAAAHVATGGGNQLRANSTKGCSLCNGNHFISGCQRFKSMNNIQRLESATRLKLCTNCLKRNHVSADCRAPGRCFLCSDKHHTLLHANGQPSEDNNRAALLRNQAGGSSHTKGEQSPPPKQLNAVGPAAYTAKISALPAFQRVLVATALVDLQNEAGDTVTVRALLDQCAELSFITKRAVQALFLKKRATDVSISGIGATSAGTATSVVNVTLRSRVNPEFHVNLDALVLKRLTSTVPSFTVEQANWEHVRGLELADPSFGLPGKIDLLVGAEVYCNLITGNLRKGTEGQPVAQETTLGWILSGPVSKKQESNPAHSTASAFSVTTDVSLHEQLQSFWNIENPPAQYPSSPQDEYCERFFLSTVRRSPSGKFIVRLPLKEDSPILGDSRSVAVARWIQQEKRLQKNLEFKEKYDDFMREYLILGHMELVTTASPTKRVYYMPHHGILKTSEAESKMRVVFNASQQSSNGVSLNDRLHAGPNVQLDL